MLNSVKKVFALVLLAVAMLGAIPNDADAAYRYTHQRTYYSTTMRTIDTVNGSGYVKTGNSAGNRWVTVSGNKSYVKLTRYINWRDFSYSTYFQF